jgi:hypothetical protein
MHTSSCERGGKAHMRRLYCDTLSDLTATRQEAVGDRSITASEVAPLALKNRRDSPPRARESHPQAVSC